MIKIKALNETSETSDEELTQPAVVTREAQEEALLAIYEEAIRTLSAGEEDVAKQMLLKLNDGLNAKTQRQKSGSEAFYHRLRFSTLKNLGLITNDLNYYLEALELDATDVSLWLKTGRRAALGLDHQLARECFESAHSLSPFNWIAIDRLIDTTFILHDIYHCFRMCCTAIDRDETYAKAVVLFNECLRLQPSLAKEMDDKYRRFVGDYEPEEYERVVNELRQLKAKRKQHFDDERQRQESKRPKLSLILDKNLSNLSFASIGAKLKSIYDRIQRNHLFPSTPIEMSFDGTASSQTDSGGNESGSANTSADESTSTVAPNGEPQPQQPKDKESKDSKDSKDKEKENNSTTAETTESATESNTNNNNHKKSFRRSNSLRNSTSNSFPTEFVDKRRSSRVKNILNKSRDIDERNVSESILELLPDSLKMSIPEERPITPEEMAEQKIAYKCINLCEKCELDYVNQFLERIKAVKNRRNVIKIMDLIEAYLCELGSAKNLIIPSIFHELYAIYRSAEELPCGPLTVIGRDIELEQIWMTLTANELKFNRNEALFLTQMLVPLELMLTKDLFNEYSVRLSMLRGTKENDNDFLNHAIDILCENEIEVMSANKVTIKYCAIKSILESQSRESMSQMMAEHNFDQLIKILMSKPESELTADEIELLNEAIVSSELWQKGVDILSTRNDLNKECLITIQKCLETGKRARLKHPLAVKLVKLAAEGYSVLPWICLYWGLIAEGYVATNAKSQLITYLKLGHQYLGRRGTCTSHNGQFLLLALNHFIDVDVEDEIFRCFTCLYNFPVRRVASGPSVSNSNIHKSPHISLKWDYCEQLYDYFAPEELPEYDSLVRQTGITQDIEGLLLRVLELVPKHLQPNDKTDPIMKYIDSGDAIGGDVTTETTHITETIYYLLADYYFKNKEFNKARHFYVLDLTLNPNRFDSWAASALTRNFEVDQQLLSGENFEQSFFDLTFASQRCFQRALQLEPTATKLWIEFGHFVYNITSTTVRLRKTSLFATSQSELTTGAIDDSIQMAKDCFEKALKTDSGDEELWLPYYMLGKVCEKSSKTLGTGALLMAIRYYEWAEMCLFVDGTSYPKKIQYYNPPYLAVEALEIHYRIHVAILKYLTLHKKVSSRLLKRLRMHLIRALRSPFSKQTAPSSATSVAPVDHDYATAAAGVSGYQRSLSTDSVSELMNDLVDTVALREERVEIGSLREQLVMMCLRAMHRCVNRYPAHYKSIYRLANYYFLKNNYIMAKQLLVGQVVLRPQDHGAGGDGQDLTESVKLIPGLFAERKNNNLFNGIWRIPIDDIDRPGSFSAHMFRSTWLLIRVCTFTQDYQMLCTIAIQLARTPDKDKQFLRNSDRQILAKFSFESCNLLLKSHYGLSPMRDKVLMDVQRIHERLTKAGVFVSEANAMIREFIPAYRR